MNAGGKTTQSIVLGCLLLLCTLFVADLAAENPGVKTAGSLIAAKPALAQEPLAESYHPYANNYEHTWTISEPGVSEIRIHFSKIELAEPIRCAIAGWYGYSCSFDYLYILDKDDSIVETYRSESGGFSEEDVWTEWYVGDSLKVKLTTDREHTAFGFIVDQKQTRGTAPPPPPPLPTPSNLSISSVSSTEITLTWQDNSNNEDGFKIERRPGSSGNWSQVGTVGANVVTCNDAGLSPETTYQYRVRAYSEAGNSDYSNSVSVTTGEAPPPPDTTPPVISDVSVQSITETGASITWTTDEPATGQVEYGKTAQYGSASTLEQTLATSHSVALADLEPGTTYHYRVRLWDDALNEVVSPDKTLSTSGTTSEASLPTQRSTALPPAPATISPRGQRFGGFGPQVVTFIWAEVTDPSGITYTLEIADNLNFFPLASGMGKTELTQTRCLVKLEPGTYYWRVKSVDSAGNESEWALCPYDFKVGYSSSLWYLAVGGFVTLILVTVLPINSRRKRLAREAKVIGEYEGKLRQWEREGYDVSHLRSKWFTPK